MDTKKLIKAIQLIIKEEVKTEVSKREKSLRASIIKEMKQSQPNVAEKDPLDVDHVFESNTKTNKSTKNRTHIQYTTIIL